MLNKYLFAVVGVLLAGCVFFYHLWDNTKMELKQVKAEKITLEQEIQRRNENEKNLSKRISELTKLYDKYSDYFNTSVPSELALRLRESCKACK